MVKSYYSNGVLLYLLSHSGTIYTHYAVLTPGSSAGFPIDLWKNVVKKTETVWLSDIHFIKRMNRSFLMVFIFPSGNSISSIRWFKLYLPQHSSFILWKVRHYAFKSTTCFLCHSVPFYTCFCLCSSASVEVIPLYLLMDWQWSILGLMQMEIVKVTLISQMSYH